MTSRNVMLVARTRTADQAADVIGKPVPNLVANTPTGRDGHIILADDDTGEPVVGIFPLAESAQYRRALLRIDMASVGRSNNYASRSRTFGYRPRRPTHFRESCGITSVAQDDPAAEAMLERYADQFAEMLAVIDPQIIAKDSATLAQVRPEWRFGDQKLWTSGVINHTAQLPYHRDRFNFPTWSAMPVLRRAVRGGCLSIPEYDLVLPCADSTVVLFKGQQYVHGVTPMSKVADDGYRFSVVYYALSGMKTCLDYTTELQQGLAKRTEREADMAKRIAKGERAIPGKGEAHRAGGNRTDSPSWKDTIL